MNEKKTKQNKNQQRAASKLDDVDNELQTLCKIIDDIAYHLTNEHFEFLFKKFEGISLKELTTHHLQLMKELGRHSYKHTIANDPTERVVNVLWNVVQDDSSVDDKLVNEAKNLLKDVLNLYYSRELRLPTLMKCASNLTEHKSVVSSLQILEKILELYPTSATATDDMDRWTVVEHLNSEFKLIQNFFEDINYFKEKAHAKAKELRKVCESDTEYFAMINQMKCINGARFTFLDEIKERLSFLDCILEQSHIRLKKQHIDIIWDAMIVNCLTPEEREEAFKWFRKMMVGNRYKSLDDDIPEHLFIQKFLKDITAESMSSSAYDSFERFFLFVNRTKGYIQIVDGGKWFYVTDFDNLIGVDYLWQIVLNAREEGVSQKSITFLNAVGNQLGSELKSQIGRIRKAMLGQSMKELSNTIATFKKTHEKAARNQCVRVLHLLHQFLSATELRGSGPYRSHNALSRGKKWYLDVVDMTRFNGYGKPPHFRLSIHENDTLWDLRCAIGTKLDRIPEMIQLYSGVKLEEESNWSTIASLNLRDGSNVHASLKDDKSQRMPLITSTKPPQLIEKAKAALENIFKKFAKNDDGTMSLNDMQAYIRFCGAGESSASKTRVQSIFTQYGDFDERLDVGGFQNFYRHAAIDRPENVWSDLQIFKYRYDLRLADDVRKEEEELLLANPEILPRCILAHETECILEMIFVKQTMHYKQYFNLLFDDCLTSEDPLIISEAWKLVLRLPTNKKLWSDVLTLESVEDESKWSNLLPPDNLFRLVYSLLICEALTELPNSVVDDKVLRERVEWRSNFLNKKGFEHLIKLLGSIKYDNKHQTWNNVISAMEIDVVSKTTTQLAISSLLKIIHSFFLSAIDYQRKKKEEKGNSGIAPMAPLRRNTNDDMRDFEGMDWSEIDWETGYSYMEAPFPEEEKEAEANDEDNQEAQLDKKFEEDIKRISAIPAELASLNQNNGTVAASQESSSSKTIASEIKTDTKSTKVEEQNRPKSEEKADREEKIPETKKDEAKSDSAHKSESIDGEKGQPTARETFIKFNEWIKLTMKTFGENLVKHLDFDELLLQMLNILKSAIRLWMSVLLARPSLLPGLFNTLKKDPSFVLGVLHSTDREISSEFAKSVRKLCRIVDESPMYSPELKKILPGVEVTRFFLRDILLNYLPKGEKTGINPEQHFYLLISLMQEYTEKYQLPLSEFGDLFKYLAEELKNYKSREAFDDTTNDKVLTGLMSLLSVLLSGEKSFRYLAGENGLLEEIFNHFLFATGKADEDRERNWPKCKTTICRKLGFRLLVQFCMESPKNFERLHQLINDLHEKVQVPAEYDFSPERSTRSTRGYVGLQNLGSTCYMNSLLQQFYMMPHFRNALIWSGREIAKSMTTEEQGNSLLFQVMRVFSFLTMSERQAFNTKDFCRSYKDETGNPVDVRVQQDVQEFFNILTDRLENELKGSQFRYLLQDCFGGQVVHQMICQGGCGKVREREQDFAMLSLPIKNRANMKESLEAYVQPEHLEGVECDTCNKKCNTLKREVLNKLPNTVFVHLKVKKKKCALIENNNNKKRFELNFETFRHEKSNQRFEFPEELNLEPFTKEGLNRIEKAKIAELNPNVEVPQPYSAHPEKYYKYKLVGVTVHSGSADAGHYYSYIKDRKTGLWTEFNDTLIRPFNNKDLDKECFGGRKNTEDNAWNMEWDNQENIRNGYLKARRKQERGKKSQDKNDSKESASEDSKVDQGEVPKKNKDLNISNLKNDQVEIETNKPSLLSQETTQSSQTEEKKEPEPIDVLEFTDTDPTKIIAPEIKTDIINNNIEFMRARQVFHPLYFKFIFDVLRVAPVPPFKEYDDQEKKNIGFPVIELATKVCFQFVARTLDKQPIFNKFIPYLKWLFENYLLKIPDNAVIRGFGELLGHVFKTLKPFEERKLQIVQIVKKTIKIKNEEKEAEEIVSVTCSAQMMNTLILLIDEAPKYWRRFLHFFLLFRDFAQLGPFHRALLVHKKLIERLGDLFLGSSSPYARDTPNKQYVQMTTRTSFPKFYPVVQTLAMLICSCHSQATRTRLQQRKLLMENDGNELSKLPETSLSHINDDGEEDLLTMSPQDERLVRVPEFYSRLVYHAHSSKEILDALNDIVCHWSFEDEKYSSEVSRIILEGIDRSVADQVTTFLRIMERFISVKDSIQHIRLEQLHGRGASILYTINYYRYQSQTFSFVCIRYIVEIMQRNEVYRRFMLQKRSDWAWWDSWLENYIHMRSYGSSSIAVDTSYDSIFLESYFKMLIQNNIEPIRNTRDDSRHFQHSPRVYDHEYERFNRPSTNIPFSEPHTQSGRSDELAEDWDELNETSHVADPIPGYEGGLTSDGRRIPSQERTTGSGIHHGNPALADSDYGLSAQPPNGPRM
ncbi:Ubiquitin carboxyl-terminal hydrolase family protein [Reticulomyxa filosa]|uniref:ubiquitinyl hydrolase 1 n=1 Tax=Reticulomyxa filosa TaxID=46433 RepID=X6MK36_RETFI|nr:Ubiquitin carboxyl-terminal hydrolase family protein [Reticulomyxa filosa]|eukprot:ETO14021.1 Ubiquitin carboxyl-terminal hydrolase family protein [Reticulomyxa filosa]